MVVLNAAQAFTKQHERDKYRAMWRHDPYRRFSPGETLLEDIKIALAMPVGASVIDFGCGTGRAAASLAKAGYSVLGLDFADNCLDKGVALPFLAADLTDLPPLSAQFGICCDVMEHIPPQFIGDVLSGIARSIDHAAFFSISLHPDAFGSVIGERLHLSVMPAEWWEEKLKGHWLEIACEVRGPTLLAVCRHMPQGLARKVEVEVEALCNTPNDKLLANVDVNSRRDLPWLTACPAHDGHAVMVGGGASLKSQLVGLAARARDGQTIFALNNAANFLNENGIRVDYQLVLDARPENVRFLKARSADKYLIGSQVDPVLLDELSGEDVTLFHWGMEGIVERLPKGKKICILSGGYVLGPIAMAAACALGYRQLHLYGYDSSDAEDGSAHAYAQDETDPEKKRLEVVIAGRRFRCSFGMFKQAEAFPAFANMLADNGCTITVHGDGLLPAVAHEMMKGSS